MKHDVENVMVILSSPSGVGKTTLTKKLQQKYQSLKISVSHTTRSPRSNEVDGVDYHFVSHKKFEELIKNNKFYEYAKIFENYYGTLKQNVDEMIKSNDILFDIDWQGTQQLAEHAGEDLIRVFILPPSTRELERRLKNRALDSESVVANRMAKAMDEISHYPEYDYIIVNTVLEDSVTNLRSILTSERHKRKRILGLTDFIKQLREGS